MAYAPGATLVVYGLPEPSVASALISAGARGVIRGGDTDLVTAVTKTVLLLGFNELPRAGAPANGTTATRSAEMRRIDAARAAARPNLARSESVGLSERALSALDTRNGGPGYTVPRSAPGGPGLEALDPVHNPALAGVYAGGRGGALPALVPQQRIDLAVTGVRPPPLTERELQVLRGMADGKSNAEIGRELFVSEDTVKTHARRLFRKLGARDRAHAVASGFRTGLVG
jgi:DNA-binding CsgD family transcriptional regulator